MIQRSSMRAQDEGRGPARSMFAASLVLHVLLLAVFPMLLTAFRSMPPKEKKTEIVFYRPPAPRPTPPPPRVVPQPKPKPKAPRVEPPRPAPPKPRPVPPVEPPPEVARLEPKPLPTPAPERKPDPPRPVVRAAGFEEARASSAAPHAPTREIRTAGFGATEGKATGPAPSGLRGSSRVGTFEVATAPGSGSAAPGPRRTSGVVGGAGFESTAKPAAPAPARTGGSVSTGEFGDTVRAAAPAPRRERPAGNPDTPVEIRSKAKPVYTPEAREKKIEGEVLLEVVFGASGEMRVLRVVEGLGFGLDESAVEAARQIKFQPARRDGTPVDHTAILRIVFQLA